MTDTPNPPNPEDFARLYMEFWQQHMAGLTRDPQVAEGIARLFDLMTAGATTFAQMMAAQRAQGPGSGAGAPKGEARGRAKDAGGEIAQRLDQMTRRVAELERRVERLEPRARVRRARVAPARSRRRPS